MATIGTLKGQRTRAKNSLDKAVAGIQAIQNRGANVSEMNRAQLTDFVKQISAKMSEITP